MTAQNGNLRRKIQLVFYNCNEYEFFSIKLIPFVDRYELLSYLIVMKGSALFSFVSLCLEIDVII